MYMDALKNDSQLVKRSGEYGGSGKVSYPKSMNFYGVMLTACVWIIMKQNYDQAIQNK